MDKDKEAEMHKLAHKVVSEWIKNPEVLKVIHDLFEEYQKKGQLSRKQFREAEAKILKLIEDSIDGH